MKRHSFKKILKSIFYCCNSTENYQESKAQYVISNQKIEMDNSEYDWGHNIKNYMEEEQ